MTKKWVYLADDGHDRNLIKALCCLLVHVCFCDQFKPLDLYITLPIPGVLMRLTKPERTFGISYVNVNFEGQYLNGNLT